MQIAQQALKRFFGFSGFREGQDKIISNILQGHDTLGIMPTGGGKSVCFQLPGCMLPGLTLVISPLISLMKDQVDTLNSVGIPASFINSSLNQSEVSQRIRKAGMGKYKILYVAPERLESGLFRAVAGSVRISLVAVDEAHCISQWGHDFRPSYRNIALFIKSLSERPIVTAFTATATEEVTTDIVKLLTMKSSTVFVLGFDRKNLSFVVFRGQNKKDFILDFLKDHRSQAGIIYAATRKEADGLYEFLAKKGFSVGRYHAGLPDRERLQTQEAFIYDNLNVMVATNAFGMGIDKSNVRYVVHYQMPKNMEAYYQEAGRAGRDGEPGECVLLFNPQDIMLQKFLIEQSISSPERKTVEYKKLQTMIDYCHTTGCLRKYILQYFGEETNFEECGNCSTCNDQSELNDITVEAQKIFSCVKRMREGFGSTLVAEVLKGSKTKKITHFGFERLSTYGIMKEYTLKEIKDMINVLIAEGYLNVTEGEFPVLKVTSKAMPVLKGEVVVRQKIQTKQEPVKEDESLFNLLRALRKKISERENVPPYIVFPDSTLRAMCAALPASPAAMLSISGVGKVKYQKYGSQFMETILAYLQEHNLSPDQAEIPRVTACAHDSSGQVSSTRDGSPGGRKNDSRPSHLITYDLYKSGQTISQIAKARRLTVQTVEKHIILCGAEGQPIDWDAIIPKKYEAAILTAIRELGSQKLRPIKNALPNEISYFAIQAVLYKYGCR